MGGSARVNGWYPRRENNEGRPTLFSPNLSFWEVQTKGRQWYGKDRGGYIFWAGISRHWRCHVLFDFDFLGYKVKARGESRLPPASGWVTASPAARLTTPP